MLTVAEETYAICKADMLLKSGGENADHFIGDAEHSTLSRTPKNGVIAMTCSP